MRITCFPLDNRPLNYAAIRRAAAVAPVEILLPPRELLGGRDSAPELFPVARWLITHAEGSELVISLDALMHGGLVQARAARPNIHRPQEALKLLGVLAHRASSASAFFVWKRVWGNIFTSRSLARTPSFQMASLELARMARGEDVEGLYARLAADPCAIGNLPADDIAVLARSRLRILAEGKAVCEACANAGILLHIAVEDSVPGGVQEEELGWLHSNVAAGQFTVADGADEVGAVLVAGAMAEKADGPPVQVFAENPLEVVAPYESRTIASNLNVLCSLARAELVQDITKAGVYLTHIPEAVDRYTDLIAGKLTPANTDDLLAATVPVASFLNHITCDLTTTNGINPALLSAFAAEETPSLATVQMNTISNRIGHSLLLAMAVAKAAPTEALAALIVENYLEDLYYQAHLRTYLVSKYGGIEPEDDVMCKDAEAELSESALSLAFRKFNGANVHGKRMRVNRVHANLPWKRWFEAEFNVEAHLQ